MSCLQAVAGRTSHFTYGKQGGIFYRALPWKKHFFKKINLREKRSGGHVSIQLARPGMPASCRLDKLLTAFPSSWSENVECKEIMLPICYHTAGKVFVLGRLAWPAVLSRQLSSCLPWKLLTPQEVFPAANTRPLRGCCVWVAGRRSRCVLRWALDCNAGGRARAYLLPVNRLLAPRSSACTLRPRLRRRVPCSHLTTEVSLFVFLQHSLTITLGKTSPRRLHSSLVLWLYLGNTHTDTHTHIK